MAFNLDETKNILKENGYNLNGSANSSQNDATEELEKDNFSKEEFDKACEDLGLEDSGKEMNDVDDFFDRLSRVNNNW